MPPDANSDGPNVKRELQEQTATTEGMEAFLNALVGHGKWTYDKDEDVWVFPDDEHVGPGKGYVVVRRGGSWSTTVIPDAH